MTTQTRPDMGELEGLLKVLASEARLDLLWLLRDPHTLDEIQITPTAARAGGSPERPISRQGVQHHLDQLADVGLVRAAPTTRKGKRAVNEWVTDRAQLFAVLEEMRRICTLRGTRQVRPSETIEYEPSPTVDWEDGAKLVLVHGVHEGKAFPLRRGDMARGRGWIIGRSPSAHVSIEYDPFVSSENAEILPTPEGPLLVDLRTAKNGTFVNWDRLAVGGERLLQAGDVIGVGKTLLVYRPE